MSDHANLDSILLMCGLTNDVIVRCSTIFIKSLETEIYASFKNEPITLPGCPSKIIAEIRFLEGIGENQGTKQSALLKSYEPLKTKLMHKHYLAYDSYVRNIGEALCMIGAHTNEAEGKKRIAKLIESKRRPNATHFEMQDIAPLCDAICNIYVNRAKDNRNTGEWIVYAVHEGKNYYLCLGTHGNENEWIDIVEQCRSDFPFLWEN